MVMNLEEKIKFISSKTTKELDHFFGLKAVTDVPRIGSDEYYLQGITPEALYTDYQDVLDVMVYFYRQGVRSWADMGCGVGRTCLLWAWLFPDAYAYGVELVPERLEEARGSSRFLRLDNVFWFETDFSSLDFELPDADVFFIYLATGPLLDVLLNKLKHLPRSVHLAVIESHGDLKPRLKLESWWLAAQGKFPLRAHRHDPYLEIYESFRPEALALEDTWKGREGILPHELDRHPSPMSYVLSKSGQKNWELVIDEGGELWTMDTLGLTFFGPGMLQGQFPQRQVSWEKSKVGLRRHAGDTRLNTWRQRRERLCYVTRQGARAQNVEIRKIILAPKHELEFSNGLRVQCSDLLQLDVQP